MIESLQHPSISQDEIRKKVAAVPFWWHSISLTPEITAPGFKTAPHLKQELENLKIPASLAGKTVLDIGAWDGFYSFEAEKRGAKKVTALDHYVWSIDWSRAFKYWEECKAKNIVPEQYENLPELWKPNELIGQKGFNTAREILQSRVEPRVGDFMSVDLASLGKFDVVFYFGVLYHMKNPFESMARLAQITQEMAIIETEAIVLPDLEDKAFFEFYETNELNGDVSNWWAPNMKGLISLCRAAGFKRAEPVGIVPAISPEGLRSRLGSLVSNRKMTPSSKSPLHFRAIVHAWK